MTPKFTTFCSSPKTLETALAAGIDALILEDPKLSLRSYELTYHPGFDHILDLANAAIAHNPKIELAFNLDIMIHHDHIPLIKILVETLKKSPIQTIRMQDPGLVVWLKQELPHFKFHLNLETGNNNKLGIQTYAQTFSSQTLNNELPFTEIQNIRKEMKTGLEIQVHGPILIQYSKRRYLADAENNHSEDLIRLSHDNDYPGRIYPFYDNIHGHLMYLYFDRCLIQDLPKLCELNMDSWLFDGRGQTPEYLGTAIRLFKEELYRLQTLKSEWQLDITHWETLKSVSPRPLKPGFFRANLTDQDRENAWETVRNAPHLATVLDFEKGQFFAIEIHRPFPKETTFTLISPKGKQVEIELTSFFDLSQKKLEGPPQTGIALVPWQKGISAQSRIYNLDDK